MSRKPGSKYELRVASCGVQGVGYLQLETWNLKLDYLAFNFLLLTFNLLLLTFSVIVHRRVAENAKTMNIFLSADPGGIGSAFHRAGRAEKKITLCALCDSAVNL